MSIWQLTTSTGGHIVCGIPERYVYKGTKLDLEIPAEYAHPFANEAEEDSMDLIIKNGTVVTTGDTFIADIGVVDGKVAQIGGTMSAPREIDASGKLVVPGGLDMHVHLQLSDPLPAGSPPRMSDDFYAGTAGAAAGGITTVGSMTSPQRDDDGGLLSMLDRAEADANANSLLDFTLHPVITDPSPETIAEIPKLVDSGYSSIKIFMVLNSFDDRQADYIKAFEAAGQYGILPMVHCEDAAINAFCEQHFLMEGKSDIRYYSDSRPTYAEAVATARAIALAKAAGTPIYLVHVSCAAALEEARRARVKGQRVYVETRPIYLYLTRELYEAPDGAKYAGWPPLREQSDVNTIWDGLRNSDVDTLCSDHAPWTLAEKLDPELKLGSFRPGMANLETLMPMLYSEGVAKGRISLSKWVELTSTNAAKLFGMFPQKGTIAVGSDADLVVWDPNLKRVIRHEDMHSKADYDVYEGHEVQGWPTHTISRGEVVYENGQITGARGRGRRVKRGPHTPL